MKDARFLWELRTDPVTQVNSFHAGVIPWESHLAWFASKLANDSTRIYIAESEDNTAIGQIRIERQTPEIAMVSLAVALAARGRGYGKAMLTKAIEQAQKDLNVQQFNAFVKPDNEPSLRLFGACGFRFQEEFMMDDVPSVKLIYRS